MWCRQADHKRACWSLSRIAMQAADRWPVYELVVSNVILTILSLHFYSVIRKIGNTAVLSKKAVTAKSSFRDKLINKLDFAVTTFLLSTADIYCNLKQPYLKSSTRLPSMHDALP